MRIFNYFLIFVLTIVFTPRTLGLIDNSPVCGVLYDLTKTFANILEFSNEYDNSGKVWSLLQAGPCPPTSQCSVYEPLCAVSEGNNYQSFLNECLMNEERRLTGRDWIKVYPGFCPEFPNYNPSTVSQRDFVEKVEPVMDTSSNLLSTASAKAVLKYISAISKQAQITSKEGISKKGEFNTSPDAASISLPNGMQLSSANNAEQPPSNANLKYSNPLPKSTNPVKEHPNSVSDASSTSLPPNDMQLSSANNADQPPSNANLKYSNPLPKSTNSVTESPNSVSEHRNPATEYRISTAVSLNSQNSSSKLLSPHFEYSNPISESPNALSKLSNPASEFVMSIPPSLIPVSVISNPTSKSSNSHLESPHKVSQSANPPTVFSNLPLNSSPTETKPINDVTTNSPRNVSTTTNYVPQSNIVSNSKSYRLTQKNLSIVPQMSLPPEFLKQISQFYKTKWPRRRVAKAGKRSSSKSKNQKRQIPHSGPYAAKAEALAFTLPYPAGQSYPETNPFIDYGNNGPQQTVGTLFSQQPHHHLASLGYIAPLQSESNPIAYLRGDTTSWAPEMFEAPPYEASFKPCSGKSLAYPTYGQENSQEYSPAFNPNYNNPPPVHYSNYPHDDSYTISYYDPNTVSYPEYEHMLENTLHAELMDFLENYQEI